MQLELMDSASASAPESSVPPGFRFHPTDEELVGYYLRKKVASQKIDLDVIRDIDLYRIEPWDLQEKCGIGDEDQREWYFFSHKDKKYPSGTRTNRATAAGFWKATGRDKAVFDRSKVIGMRKTLVFYQGRAPNGCRSDWIMHEYRLESEENASPKEEGWVVCRAFRKQTTGKSKTGIELLDSACYYDESTVDYITSKQQRHKFVSRNLPPTRRLAPVSLTAENKAVEDEDRYIGEGNSEKVTDWRDLDKFVASQLSHGDHYDSEMGLLQFKSGREEGGYKLNQLSTSDIGICIFNK